MPDIPEVNYLAVKAVEDSSFRSIDEWMASEERDRKKLKLLFAASYEAAAQLGSAAARRELPDFVVPFWPTLSSTAFFKKILSDALNNLSSKMLDISLRSRLRAGMSVLVRRAFSDARAAVYTAVAESLLSMKVVATWRLSRLRVKHCPECISLDGVTVDLGDSFPSGTTSIFLNLKSPPRHPNCGCVLELSIVPA